MVSESELINSLVGMVPHWYVAEHGSCRNHFSIRDRPYYFFGLRPSAVTQDLRIFMQKNVEDWFNLITGLGVPGAIEAVQELVALRWLRLANPSVDWGRLLAYLRSLRFRTYENEPASLNLVISQGQGNLDITDLDLSLPVAKSRQVYICIDNSLRFLGYEEILWSEIRETTTYKFNPEFLQPFASTLEKDDFSVHLTTMGDLVVMNHLGLLAANRKGRWYLYDANVLPQSIAQIFRSRMRPNSPRVARNVIEIMFDLSYNRHGALLVFDPYRKVVSNVVNKECILENCGETENILYNTIGDPVRRIHMGLRQHKKRKKRLFLEVAEMDGAVIFDEDEVLAFGAYISLGQQTGNHRGTRTTAAYAALACGGIPVKVSSDGDISILFRSHSEDGRECVAELRFL